MKLSLLASLVIVSAIALPACTADSTGAPGSTAQEAQPLVSTYEYQGSVLELTGRPKASGDFDITMRLGTTQGMRSITFDPQTAGDELTSQIVGALGAMGPAMIASVRGALGSAPAPSAELEARWLFMQQEIFQAQIQGEVQPHMPMEELCGYIGGTVRPCGDGVSCCVFNHTSICDAVCSAVYG